jgi:hypothetical protein
MSCDICGPKNPNNPRWSVTHACLDSLIERVAKLEATVEPSPTFEQFVAKVGPLPTTGLASAESPPVVARAITKAADLPCNTAKSNETDRSPSSPASGQLASAGEAPVPPGWKLAPGWSYGAHRTYDWRCWHGLDDDGEEVGETCKLRGPYLLQEGGSASKGACAAHAVEMGALVKDEPPGYRTVPAGLYRKFSVERTDGSSEPGGKHEHCNYFVLDWAHDKYARAAALAYATACEAEYPDLARDLRDRAAAVVAHAEPPRAVPLVRDEPPAEPVSPALCGDVGPRDAFCSRYEGHELPHRGWKGDKGSEWWPRGVTPPPASWESATESVSAPAEQPITCDCREIETTPGLDPTGSICACGCHWGGVRKPSRPPEHVPACCAYGLCPEHQPVTSANLTGIPKPPAEQPSRQETDGGETGEEMHCDTCGGRCDGPCEEGDEQFEQACRDRAKAKAAELDDRQRADILAAVAAVQPRAAAFEHKPSRAALDMVLDAKPPEPSGTGQLPSAPVEPVEEMRELAAAMVEDSEIHRWHTRSDRQELADGIRTLKLPRKPIAEPPEPAAGMLSEPFPGHRDAETIRNRDAQIEHLRRALQETRDKLAQAERDKASATQSLADEYDARKQAERERDELAQGRKDAVARLDKVREERDERGRQVEQMAEHVATMRVERDEAVSVLRFMAGLIVDFKRFAEEVVAVATDGEREVKLATLDVELHKTLINEARKNRDEATAKERARCLAWAVQHIDTAAGELDDNRFLGDIRSGKPAPGTGKP